MEMMKIKREETLQLFDRPTVSLKKFIVFFLWLITGPECSTGSAMRELTAQTGGSVIIPCYYDRKYTEHKKYWCFHAKAAYNYCSILAYANETKGKVSVIDHPDQSFFTVTMRNLQHEDTGTYWCGEEIKGILLDETEQLRLTVQSAPGVSVMNSSVSGHEGDNVSVQCFYTSGYQYKLKQWCRYKDQRCVTVGRTDTSQNSSVQISDDGRTSSFTVLMTGLRLSDAGWYYCSAGDLQVSVQLTVTAVVTTEVFDKNGNNNSTSSSEEQQNKHYGYLEVWIPTVVLFLLLVTVVSAVKLRKKNNRNNTHITEVTRDRDSDAGNGVCSSSVVAENDVTYSAVTVRPKTKAISPVSVEDEVTYSSVHKQ